MTLTRRRLLVISAAAAVLPSRVDAASVWIGRALGAEARVTLRGPGNLTRATQARIASALTEIEAQFSLHDPRSALSRLNRDGHLPAPSREMRALFRTCTALHRLTGGAFDPTVQALWRSHALGLDTRAARRFVGWERLRIDDTAITLAPGQQVTLNGIAQGHATDRIAILLRDAGYRDILVSVGEDRALGGPFRMQIEDPVHGALGQVTLDGTAQATSSPTALRIGSALHVLDPRRDRRPVWSTVSVTAQEATLADGLSTAFCLMPEKEIAAVMAAIPGCLAVRLLGVDGRLRTLS